MIIVRRTATVTMRGLARPAVGGLAGITALRAYAAESDSREHVVASEPGAIDQITKDIASSDRIAFSARYNNYATYVTPRLVLACIATDNAVAIVDCRAENRDAVNDLFQTIGSSNTEVLLYNGVMEQRILYGLTGKDSPSDRVPVYDLSIASALASAQHPRSLPQLIASLLDAEPRTLYDSAGKVFQNRPLSPEIQEQCFYSVKYSHALYNALNQQLADKGRDGWMAYEMTDGTQTVMAVDSLSEEDYWNNSYDFFASLSGPTLAIARELIMLRHRIGLRDNIKPQTLISNMDTRRIAIRKPYSVRDLQDVTDVRDWVIDRYGEEMIQAITTGNAVTSEEARSYRVAIPTDSQMAIPLLARAYARSLLTDQDVHASLAGSRRQFERALKTKSTSGGVEDMWFMKDWRRDVYGQAVSDLLAGNKSVSVNGSTLSFS